MHMLGYIETKCAFLNIFNKNYISGIYPLSKDTQPSLGILSRERIALKFLT